MKMGLATWLTCAAASLVGGAIALNGCTPDGAIINNTAAEDAGAGDAQRCTPNAKECVTPTLARVCPADGSEWAALKCSVGEKCDAGECKPDPNAACKKGQGSCVNATTALRCRDTLAGFEQVTCPASTTCTGDGLCMGACVVGSSKCLPDGSVATCADGKTYTSTACPGGQLCVATETAPVELSACKPAECVPFNPADPTCNATCGNKVDAAADQTKFTSECTATPSGYKWVPTSCVTGTTCSPFSIGCPSGGAEASCLGDCAPGQMRCSPNGLGTQTCGADRKWAAAITSCNANPGTSGLVCMQKPDDPAKVVCGDPICAAGRTGTCAGVQLKACGNDGRLGAAAACPAGTGQCVAVAGAPIGGVTAGACQVQCRVGEERCSSASGFQTCANGLWTTPQTCPAVAGAATCLNYTTSLGLQAKICNAVCAPGATECQTVTTANDTIRTCKADGTWDVNVTCTVGACTGGGGSARCLAQCIPNSLVCVGAGKDVPGTSTDVGTNAVATCTAAGMIPTATTACTGTTVCRRDITGATIAVAGNACLECIGSGIAGGNELGQTDLRCANAGGTATGTATTQLCAAGNVWTAGTTTDCTAIGKTCQQTVQACQRTGRGLEFVESRILARRGITCAQHGRGAAKQCGATPDCCGNNCGTAPGPANCR